MDTMLRSCAFSHSIRAAGSLRAALAIGARLDARPRHAPRRRQPHRPSLVFLRSTPVGTEQVAVERTAEWLDDHEQRPRRAAGRSRRPQPAGALRRGLEAARADDRRHAARPGDDHAHHGDRHDGRKRDDPLARRRDPNATRSTRSAVLLPNPFVAPYEALAAAAERPTPGRAISDLQPAQGSFASRSDASTTEHIKTVDRTITARPHALDVRRRRTRRRSTSKSGATRTAGCCA